MCCFVVQDAVRLYLINSPVVRAETLRFKKEGVYGVVSSAVNCFLLFFTFREFYLILSSHYFHQAKMF